ncbi:MAG: cation transporter [Rickettsiales bacterium]|jgi:Co/Zn/Cd efflux system component|nr:cation transporter [Rickettsiales bacterium]
MGSHHDHAHDHLSHDHRVLITVFVLNFAMFGLEFWQGMKSDSTALIADSMDFLSDSFSYLLTLYVLASSLRVRARAALIKAGLMLLLAAAALGQGVYNIMHQHVPDYVTMGWVGLLALLVNVTSAILLYRSRERDSNMQSVWLCSRNDAITNVAILIAAGLVFMTHSLWPDLFVALFITWLEGSSALKIIRQAKKELRNGH